MNIIDANAGEMIHMLARRVVDQCNREQREYLLRHNDTTVRVYPGSHEFDITEKWDLQRQLRQSARIY